MNSLNTSIRNSMRLSCHRPAGRVRISTVGSKSLVYGFRSYSAKIVQEDDIVLLKHRNATGVPLLTGKLRAGKKITLSTTWKDTIQHDHIIGRGVRDLVSSKKGVVYRIVEPTLAEYTDNSARLVTPIYSQDASLIVSLLDLNPPSPISNTENGETLEIFEAGTGHGALTLHLARAIHAANMPAPAIPEKPSPSFASEKILHFGSPSIEVRQTEVVEGVSDSSTQKGDDVVEETSESQKEEEPQSSISSADLLEPTPPASPEEVVPKSQDDPKKTEYESWKANRRAVLHTLDIHEANSIHAEQVVKNFRHGMYFPHVDFHTGTIEDYVSARLEASSNKPVFDHAILDLPATQNYFEILGKAMKPDGTLIGFCPSITQINACVILAKQKSLPFFLEKVLEIGGGVGTGGKEWDVRLVKPRALLKSEPRAPILWESGKEGVKDIPTDDKPSEVSTAGWEMVCRPKVGAKVFGGGFVGVWRRIA